MWTRVNNKKNRLILITGSRRIEIVSFENRHQFIKISMLNKDINKAYKG